MIFKRPLCNLIKNAYPCVHQILPEMARHGTGFHYDFDHTKPEVGDGAMTFIASCSFCSVLNSQLFSTAGSRVPAASWPVRAAFL